MRSDYSPGHHAVRESIPEQQHLPQPKWQLISRETYVGLTSVTFKEKFINHIKSFNHQEYSNETTLSQHIWNIKNRGGLYNVTWKIVALAKEYNPITKKCNLCSKERYYIIFKPDKSTLNKRTELTTKCRHRRKYLLCNNWEHKQLTTFLIFTSLSLYTLTVNLQKVPSD